MTSTAVLITTKRKIKIINQNAISKHLKEGFIKLSASRVLALPNIDTLWAYFNPRSAVKSRLGTEYLNLEVHGPLILAFDPDTKKNVLESSLRIKPIHTLTISEREELESNLKELFDYLNLSEPAEDFSLPFNPEETRSIDNLIEEIESGVNNPEPPPEDNMAGLESLLESIDIDKIKQQAPKIQKRLPKLVNQKQLKKLMKDTGIDENMVKKFSAMFQK